MQPDITTDAPPVIWPCLSTNTEDGQQRRIECFSWVAKEMRQPLQWVLDIYAHGTPEQRNEIKQLMALYHYEHYRSPFEERYPGRAEVDRLAKQRVVTVVRRAVIACMIAVAVLFIFR